MIVFSTKRKKNTKLILISNLDVSHRVGGHCASGNLKGCIYNTTLVIKVLLLDHWSSIEEMLEVVFYVISQWLLDFQEKLLA